MFKKSRGDVLNKITREREREGIVRTHKLLKNKIMKSKGKGKEGDPLPPKEKRGGGRTRAGSAIRGYQASKRARAKMEAKLLREIFQKRRT